MGLRLQVGKTYVMRDGRTVLITDRYTGQEFSYQGTIDGNQAYDCWRPDGTWGYMRDAFDIVSLSVTQVPYEDENSPDALLAEDSDDALQVTANVLLEVQAERVRQESKWGQQNHTPTGWLPILAEEFGEVARAICEATASKMIDVSEKHLDNYREELVQVAAVAVAMVESLDRNR